MIKPNELRINNLVYNNDEISYPGKGVIKVSEIKERGINSWQDMGHSGFLKFEQLSGIPIGEDWLQKFGFVKESYTYSYSIKIHNIYIWYHLPSVRVEIAGYNSDIIYLPSKKPYVHQLQNLVFGITEEELELKQIT